MPIFHGRCLAFMKPNDLPQLQGPAMHSLQSRTQIHMSEERDGLTKDWSNWLEYDASQGFFKKFNLGYVGKVEIPREIK